MAAPELRLNVSLDLGFFRQQLQKLSGIATSEFNAPLKVRFDRTTLNNEIRLLNRYVNNKTFNIKIKTNLEAEINAADRLVQALQRVQQASGKTKNGLPLGVQGLSRTAGQGGVSAAEIKALFSAAIQGGLLDKKTLGNTRAQMVAALGAIGRDSIEGLLNGLESGDAKLQKAAQFLGKSLITSFKNVLGIASPSREFRKIGDDAGKGFEQGLLKAMEIAERSATRQMQRMLDRLARMALMMGGMSAAEISRQIQATRTLPSLNWAATAPSNIPPIGPSSTGRALPGSPARPMLSAGAFAGFLPGRPSQASVLELNNILAGAIREYFKAVANQIKAPAGVSGLPMLAGARPPLMLPPAGGTTPAGATRFNVVSTGAYVGQPGFMRAPSMPSVPRQQLTGQSSPLASPLGAGYFTVGKGLQGIQQAYGKAKPFFDTKRFPVTGAIAELGSEFGTALKQVLLYGTAYKALAFLTGVPGQAFDAAKALATYRNQLQAVTKQTETFDQSFAFVDNLAQRFNVPLESARQGFVKLFASMQPAGFEQGQIENLFTGIAKASAAFGLSADKVDRVNYAFAQMASKGQIMSEELKGQLGDVLPGALGLFAEAAQMSIPEFSKAMEDGAFKGKAMEQVLDNVGILLNTKFGPAAQGAAKTLQGAVNQIQNNLQLMYEGMTPIVNAFAATFGPQVNSLIKDVTSVVQVLTGTFVRAGEGVNALTPRAQALYNAFKTLEPSLRQAGAAIADLGGRFATLLPAIIQATAAAITLASSPLGRGALLAAVAIGTLTAALKLLEVTGLKAALKGVYAFIGGLLKIPAATGVARVAVIGLKLAVTGLFVGAILIGLDFLIGKIFKIGDAANDSAKDLRVMGGELDALAGAGDIESTTKAYLDANTKLALARKKNQQALAILRAQKQLPGEPGSEAGVGAFGSSAAQREVDATFAAVIAAQKELDQARRSRDNAVKQKDQQEQQLQSQLQKIDLSGGEAKEQSLESYHSLADQLAKDSADFAAAQTEEEFRHKIELLELYYDIQEARANAYQKEALRFEREMMMIEAKRREARLKAELEVQKAQASVAGGAAMVGGTGAIFGATGRTFNAPGWVHGHFQNQNREALVQDTVEVVMNLLSQGVSPELGSGARFKAGMSQGQVEGLVRQGIASHKQYASGIGAIDVFVPAGTNVPVPVSGISNLGGAAGVSGTLSRGTQLMHLDPRSTSAGARRKVPASEKRDILAEQNTLQAAIAKTATERMADAKAAQEQIVAFERYKAVAFPTAEQELQNNLLVKRNELFRSGATEDQIEKEIKLFENQEKGRFGLEALARLEAKGIITKKQAAELTRQLNSELAKQNGLIEQQVQLTQQQKFDETIKNLRDQIALLQTINDEEARRLELQKAGYSAAQIQQIIDLEEVKKNLENVRATIDDFVTSTSNDYKGFFKAVLFGEDPVEALKEFQKRLADKVLTIFLDFTMAPVEEFFKEQLRGMLLPEGEESKGVEGANAMPQNVAQIAADVKSIATSIASGAGADQTTSVNQAIEGIGGTAMTGGEAVPGDVAGSIQQATQEVNQQGVAFKESLGKAVGAIGVAAGSIMGIAGGIAQIKEGGTSNVLGGIGSILMGIGGGISGFGSLFKLPGFANGGMVTGPTLGLVGEGKYNEAIVPLPNGRSIPVQMQGESIREKMGGGTSGAAAPPMLSMSFQSTTINGVEYVDRAQLEAAMAETRRMATRDGAARGANLALDKLANSPSSRRRVGLR